MSNRIAGFAGFLAVVAVATPHIGGMVPSVAHAGTIATPAAGGRDAVAIAALPVIVAAPLPFPPARIGQAPAYSISATSDLVSLGDAKASDFDPEHPPADMGEPG